MLAPAQINASTVCPPGTPRPLGAPARPVELTLEANRALAEEDLAGADVIREPLKLTA
jgi:hypothetical protein